MREYIVFTNREHYNDLGIVRSLGEDGISPILIAVKGPCKFVGYSKYVKECHYVDNAEIGVNLILSKYANEREKSFILSGNDVIDTVLDEHYDELNPFFYFYNAGEKGRIRYYMDKSNMLELARNCGFKCAPTWRTSVGEIPDDIEYPIITKAINPISGEWKDIVYVCNDENDLSYAFSKMKSSQVLLQKYIDKSDEVSFQGISVRNGKDVVIVTTMRQEYNLSGTYSPLWIVENSNNEVVEKKIKKMIREMSYEGIFEFEFIKDKDGNLWFLEINMRHAADGYATTVAGMSQVILWCESIETGRISPEYYKDIPSGFRAIAECWDYDVRVKGGLLSKHDWLRQYKQIECKLYRGRNDFVPFFLFMWYKLTKMNH